MAPSKLTALIYWSKKAALLALIAKAVPAPKAQTAPILVPAKALALALVREQITVMLVAPGMVAMEAMEALVAQVGLPMAALCCPKISAAEEGMFLNF